MVFSLKPAFLPNRSIISSMGRGNRTKSTTKSIVSNPNVLRNNLEDHYRSRKPGEISYLLPRSAPFFLPDIDNKIRSIDRPAIKKAEIPEKIMVDIDSTLYPLMYAMRLINGHNHIVPERIYDYNDLYHISSAEAIHESCGIDTMRQIGLIPGALSAVHKMQEHNLELHFLTHRATSLGEETRGFLVEEGIEVEHFECDLTFAKIPYCNEHGISQIIDDKPVTLDEAKASNIGAHTLAWSYTSEISREHGIPVTHNWYDLLNSVFDTIESSENAK